MGVIHTGYVVSEAVVPVLVGRLHDVTGSYATGFTAVIGFAIAGAIAVAFLPRPTPSDGRTVGQPDRNAPTVRPSDRPTVRRIGIIMNGRTGRMGLHQHPIRSLV